MARFSPGRLVRRGGGKPAAVPDQAPRAEDGAHRSQPERRSLSGLASEIFSLVLSLRAGTDLGEPTEVRQKIERLLESFRRDAEKAGHRSEAVADAHFAIVALIDEAVLNSEWKRGRDAWRILTLQQQLFRINTAGDDFYKKLDHLRGNVAENAEALEVFFDCLALGFQGRFRLFGREKLDELITGFSRDLARGRKWNVAELSPNWRRPDDFSEVVGEGVPMWVTALFFVPGVFLLILLFALLARNTAGRTASELQNLLQTLGA